MFYFCSSVCFYEREINVVHCKRNPFPVNFGLVDFLNPFSQSSSLSLKHYELEEICLKFPITKATGGVKTHPGLVSHSDAASSVCVCRRVKAAASRSSVHDVQGLVLCGHSSREN